MKQLPKKGIILIASHARFSDEGQLVNGTSSQFISYLEKQHVSYLSLFHSLFAGFPTLITGSKKRSKKTGLAFLPFSLKLLQDTFITSWYIWKNKKHINLFIGINPVNAVVGSLFKKMGILKKVVYYTADYSHKRFTNSFLNNFYLFLDDIAVKNADAVWNVSTRIQEERIKKYGDSAKFFVLPNSLPFPKKEASTRYNKYAMVLVTHMTKSIHFDMLLSAIQKLYKKFPKIQLHIVGDGYERKRVEKEVEKNSLKKIVFFHGHLPHKQVIQLLKKCGVGLGIYTNDNSWTRFGDSMKVREYVAYGLPVIITDVPSTAEDIKKYNAGIVIRQNEKEFHAAVNQLFSSAFTDYKKNALKMAKENDYFVVLKRLLDFVHI